MIPVIGGKIMTGVAEDISVVRCQCGSVELAVAGAPILSTICHCTSCKEAGHLLQALSGALPVLDASNGTAFTLFRKDRVRPIRGSNLLSEHRLKPESATRRVVATCCNTAMFLDFTKGHWLSVYGGRIVASQAATVTPPPIESGLALFWRLMIAWVAMRFRTPKIDYVAAKLNLDPSLSAL
jgi:hypothetical protein